VNGDCLSKRCLLVSEADGDEVVEEVVEPIDVAGRIGREVARPLDSPLERGIGSTRSVNIPPPSGLQHDERIRRWPLAREPTGNQPDFVGDIVGFDVF